LTFIIIFVGYTLNLKVLKAQNLKSKTTAIYIISVICFLALLSTYISRISIFETLEIKVISNNENTFNKKITFFGKSSLGRKNILKTVSVNETFTLSELYLNKICVKIPEEILSDSIDILINNKVFGIIKSGQNPGVAFLKNEKQYYVEIPYYTEKNLVNKLIFVSKVFFNKFLFLVLFLLIASIYIFFLFRTFNDKTIKLINYLFICLILVWGYFWLVLASLYSFPNVEEIALSLSTRFGSLQDSLFYSLSFDDGRYSTYFLHAYNPFSLFGFEFYKLIPIISIVVFIFSTYYIIRTVTKNEIDKKKILLFSLVFVLIYFTISPSIFANLYWGFCSFVNLYPWCFYAIFWVLFYRYISYPQRNIKKIFYFISSSVFVILSIGLNEMFIVLFCATILYLLALALRQYEVKDILPTILIILICLVFILLVPGTSSRLTRQGGIQIKDIENIFRYAILGLREWLIYIYKLLLQLPILIPAILIISIYMIKLNPFKKYSQKKLTIIIIFSSIILFIMTLPFFIPSKENILFSERIFNSILIGTMIQLNIISVIISRLVEKNIKIISIINKYNFKITNIALLVFSFFILFQKNNLNLIIEEYSTGIFKYYKAYNNQFIYNPKEIHNNIETITINEYNPEKHSRVLEEVVLRINNNGKMPNFAIFYESYFDVDEIRYAEDSISKLEIIKIYVKKEINKTVLINE